jgi:hypothetical protein
MIQLSRRSLITGLISLVAAPAIVRAGSLMPVSIRLAGESYLDEVCRLYGIVRRPSEVDEAMRQWLIQMQYATADLGHRFDPIKAFGWEC